MRIKTMEGIKILNINDLKIYVKIPYPMRNLAQDLEGSWWHPEAKYWSCTNTAWNREVLGISVTGNDVDMAIVNTVSEDVSELVKELRNRQWALTPFEHQYEMTARLLHYKQYGMLTEMGTGKTKAVIDAIGVLINRGDINKVIVVAPNSVLYTWTKELMANGFNKDLFNVLTGTAKQRHKLLGEGKPINIINYEGVLVMQNALASTFNNDKAFVALDESSRIKNFRAKTTEAIQDTFVNNKYKTIMSGTPITQSPLDIYSQYKFLNEQFLPFNSYYAFRGRYAVMGGYLNKQVIAYNRLEELKKLIAQHSIILKKEDCLDLPPKIYIKHILELKGKIAKQYKEMHKDLMIEVSKNVVKGSNPLTRLVRLQQITSGIYVEERHNHKLKELFDILDDNLEEGKKIIVWCWYIESIRRVQGFLKKKKIKSVNIEGKVPVEQRQNHVDMFNESKDCNVIIVQLRTGGMGINLQAANTVIYYENNFSLQDRQQSEDRVHRSGLEHKVTYIDLCYKNTIDEMILEAVKAKKDIADYLIESYRKNT